MFAHIRKERPLKIGSNWQRTELFHFQGGAWARLLPACLACESGVPGVCPNGYSGGGRALPWGIALLLFMAAGERVAPWDNYGDGVLTCALM